MTRRNARKQEWVFPLFSPNSDVRLSLNFHRIVILYISCDTRSVGLGQYCLPKVYNGFKATGSWSRCLVNFISKENHRKAKDKATQTNVYNTRRAWSRFSEIIDDIFNNLQVIFWYRPQRFIVVQDWDKNHQC